MQISPNGQSLPRKLLALIIPGLYLTTDNVSSIECISTQVYSILCTPTKTSWGGGGGGEEEGASFTPSHFMSMKPELVHACTKVLATCGSPLPGWNAACTVIYCRVTLLGFSKNLLAPIYKQQQGH